MDDGLTKEQLYALLVPPDIDACVKEAYQNKLNAMTIEDASELFEVIEKKDADEMQTYELNNGEKFLWFLTEAFAYGYAAGHHDFIVAIKQSLDEIFDE